MEPKPTGSPTDSLLRIASENNMDIFSLDFAKFMDENDELKEYRDRFVIPKKKDLVPIDLDLCDGEEDCLYFTGHSLGLALKSLKEVVVDVYEDWAKQGNLSRYYGKYPNAYTENPLKPGFAQLTGSMEAEVVAMNSLSVNLNLLSASFYKPTKERHKILVESPCYPSDRYAMRRLLDFHGYTSKDALIELEPREGEDCLRDEDIIEFVQKNGNEIALIMFGVSQHCTGQVFDLENITRVGHEQGCVVGFDVAHGIGNVELRLHDWNVDFAVFSTYKFLNGSPGGLAGAFVHENNFHVQPALTGWWGCNQLVKYQSPKEIVPGEGADKFKISNCSTFLSTIANAAMQVVLEAGMEEILKKQFYLTGYLEFLLKDLFEKIDKEERSRANEDEPYQSFAKILTPSEPKRRGALLSMTFKNLSSAEIIEECVKRGAVIDIRQPNTIRLGSIPLYNRFEDIHKFVPILKAILEKLLNLHE